jgi:AcrR family transcriptional regulator
MLSVKAVQTSRLTRKESTELTRRRLIDGAIEILRRDGVAAATTGRIASAAGLKQPSFYVHFADRDQVFEAAAAEIGRRVIGILKRQLRAIDRAHPRRSIRATYAAMTTAFLSEPELTRIFLRHRIDDGTVLGATFRRLLDQARSELVESVARYGVVLPRDTAEAHVELLVAAVLGLLEGLLDGRLRDRGAAVDAISNATIAMFRSLTRDRTGPAPATAAASRSRPKEQK